MCCHSKIVYLIHIKKGASGGSFINVCFVDTGISERVTVKWKKDTSMKGHGAMHQIDKHLTVSGVGFHRKH